MLIKEKLIDTGKQRNKTDIATFSQSFPPPHFAGVDEREEK